MTGVHLALRGVREVLMTADLPIPDFAADLQCKCWAKGEATPPNTLQGITQQGRQGASPISDFAGQR